MKYVTCYGHVYRLTDAAFKRLEAAIHDKTDYDLDALGKDLGPCVSVHNMEEGRDLEQQIGEN